MNTLAERLKYARERLDLTQQEVASRAGMSQPTYYKIESGKSQRTTYLNELANVLKVNPHWLATGQGAMNNNGILIAGSNTNTGVQIGQASGATRIHGFSPVLDWDDSTPVDADEVEMTFYKSLGFACGHGAEGEALSSEWRKLRFSRMTLERLGIYPDQAFAATAHDDSMTPTICDGDTIFVDRGRNKIKDGRIFAIEHGGLFYCKRLYNLPNGGVRIVSDNGDEFPERSLSRDEVEIEGFRVIGWVFSISRLERW